MPHETGKDGAVLLDDVTTVSGLEQAKALIRFYFGTQPITTEDVFKEWGQLYFCLKFDGKVKAIEAPQVR